MDVQQDKKKRVRPGLITVDLGLEAAAQLQAKAKAEGRTVTSVMRALAKAYLNGSVKIEETVTAV